MVEFQHPLYILVDGDRVERKPDAPGNTPTYDEQGELMQEIGRYVQAKIIEEFGFEQLPIPEDDVKASTSILVTTDWQTSRRLLIIAQNASGSLMGIFSRSLCLEEGLSQGSMISYIRKAREIGYAVMLLRPNTNSVLTEVSTDLGTAMVKVPIQGSESPEAHAMYVWENIVPRAEKAEHIVLLGYGNGASLCKDLYTRQVVRSKQDEVERNRICGVVTIEASSLLEEDDAEDIKTGLGSLAVNMEGCRVEGAKMGCSLKFREEKLGCPTFSLGNPSRRKKNKEGGDRVENVATSVSLALKPVFDYISTSEKIPSAELAKHFMTEMATKYGLADDAAEIKNNPLAKVEEQQLQLDALQLKDGGAVDDQRNDREGGNWGIWKWLFGSGPDEGGGRTRSMDSNYKMQVSDFDLLKVVGKGAFGKVMLVRKKEGRSAGQVFAMKVLKKSVVAAKGQVEHTMSEREILCEIQHPFIVRLRFAFQSNEKLYLVTDYYNGGSLFYHLRKARCFSLKRARFYAAELLSALSHLHGQHIIYRDLKLENVLMDSTGHIALTDFGLSKQNIDVTGGATTFCGTAEYIAPELLKGSRYGAAVDWWSFGVLLYEMTYGKTPFYDKNRKLMFYRIINTAPTFPSMFPEDLCEVLTGLLTVNEANRLGSGPDGSEAIRKSRFFSSVDFDKLLAKEIPPPFTPEVHHEFDTKYVPKTYLQAEVKDSVAEPMKRGQKAEFDAFTYEGEKAMTMVSEDELMAETDAVDEE